MQKKKSVLVTGAGGYIGTILVPLLLQKGYKVKAFDRFFFGRNLLPKTYELELIKEDSRKLCEHHLQGVDYMIDLVSISNDPSGEKYKKSTYEINRDSRIKNAQLAKKMGLQRYLLPSTCSVYGYQPDGHDVNENSKINPLTTYAIANSMAEKGVLSLNDDLFSVSVLRQATVYGYSPRMRFDLAVNGMIFGAWKFRNLPVMRDGFQWRPMIHVIDVSLAQIFMLEAPTKLVAGQVFNVGSSCSNYQIGPLAKIIAQNIGEDVVLQWYGDSDNRSYKVNFAKIKELGFKPKRNIEFAIKEIVDKLEKGLIDKTNKTITLDWYNELIKWQKIIKDTEMYQGILEI